MKSPSYDAIYNMHQATLSRLLTLQDRILEVDDHDEIERIIEQCNELQRKLNNYARRMQYMRSSNGA